MPAWYHNLRAQPQDEIQVDRQRFQVDREIVPAEEHARLWAAWLKQHPAYERARASDGKAFSAYATHGP